jgi:predicted short-subunit dehydrogenase-like oxidoreductase (DUF2520 family)
MLNIVVLGTGNLAKHLFQAFSKTDKAQVVQVVGRNQDQLQWFADSVSVSNDFSSILDADVYLVSVKDDAIGQVSNFLSEKNGVVAHTSGAVSLHSISGKQKGVFYPVQTFTKGKTLDFTTIPICVEGNDNVSFGILEELAKSISEQVYQINSDQRKKLHLAAVFVNNFTNYLYGVGEAVCMDSNLSFDLLKPLILETAEKVQYLSPKEAQTGPARRGDQNSIQEHLKLLKDKKQIELYKLCSAAIEHIYEKEL